MNKTFLFSITLFATLVTPLLPQDKQPLQHRIFVVEERPIRRRQPRLRNRTMRVVDQVTRIQIPVARLSPELQAIIRTLELQTIREQDTDQLPAGRGQDAQHE